MMKLGGQYLGIVVLVAQISALQPRLALAAPVAIGAVVLECDVNPPGQCCATVAFDNTPFDVFGTTVNLGADVGTCTTTDVLTIWHPDTKSGTYTHTLQSFPDPNLFGYEGAGSFVCADANPGCVTPASYVGSVTNLAGSVALPAALSYTEDGTADFVQGPTVPSVPSCPIGTVNVFQGPFGINAFQPQDTPTGTDVSVSSSTTFFNSGTGTAVLVDIGVTYAQVSSAGETVAIAFSNGAGVVPANFAAQVDGQCSNDPLTACCADASCPGGTCEGCYRAAFVDVSTTATVSGPIEVCSIYQDADSDGFVDNTNVDERRLRILHEEGGVFVDRTVSRDPASNRICAEVSSLSQFLLAASTCGNGTVDTGEDCDDGNPLDGDCCSSTCQFEVQGSPCSDGILCTSDTCDGNGSCVSASQAGCRTAEKSLLLIKDSSDDTKDKLIWKWLKGEATAREEFGVPAGTTTLCLFAGTVEALIADATIPANSMKWALISDKGYKYSAPSGSPDGIQQAVLKGGAAGKAKVLVKGKGSNLPDPALGTGLPLPVKAQLLNSSNDVCFEGVYATGDVIKNDGSQFKAKEQ